MTSKKRVQKFLGYLEEQLEDQSISITKFAKDMGVSRHTVYTWLWGDAVMSLEKYFKALDVLGIEEKLFEKKS